MRRFLRINHFYTGFFNLIPFCVVTTGIKKAIELYYLLRFFGCVISGKVKFELLNSVHKIEEQPPAE